MKRDLHSIKPAAVQKPLALAALLFCLIYIFAVLVHVAPMSPASKIIKPFTDKLIKPRFIQRWTLFAPELSTDNLTAYVQVRYRTPEGTGESKLVNISDRLFGQSRARRFFPSRLQRMGSYLAREGVNLVILEARAAQAQTANSGKPLPKVLQDDLTKRRKELDLGYRKFLSASASSFDWPGEIVEVRGVVVRHPVPKFGASEIPKSELGLDFGWMLFMSEMPSL